MKATQCVPQKISKFTIGSIMLTAAAALVVIGVTLMPVFGFVMAIPVTVLAIFILFGST
jgi:hypothetical protein